MVKGMLLSRHYGTQYDRGYGQDNKAREVISLGLLFHLIHHTKGQTKGRVCGFLSTDFYYRNADSLKGGNY
jgi:hypothetical protein